MDGGMVEWTDGRMDGWMNDGWTQFLLIWGIIGKMEKKKKGELGEMDPLLCSFLWSKSESNFVSWRSFSSNVMLGELSSDVYQGR